MEDVAQRAWGSIFEKVHGLAIITPHLHVFGNWYSTFMQPVYCAYRLRQVDPNLSPLKDPIAITMVILWEYC